MIFFKLISLAVVSYVSIYSVFICVKTETSNYINGLFDKTPVINTTKINFNNRIDRNVTQVNETEYDCLPFNVSNEERMRDFINSTHYKSNLTFNEKRILNHKNFHLIPSKCGLMKKTRTKRLENGHLVNEENFPWIARIATITDSYLIFSCSGTVINEHYILTAGHCLSIGNESSMRVLIGNDYENSLTNYFLIDKFIRHENYTNKNATHPKTRKRHDIGIIRLKEPIPKSNFYPICLPFSPSNFKFPKKLKHFNFALGDSNYIPTRFIGVGRGNSNSSKSELKYADFKIINLQTCRSEHKCLGKNGIINRARIIEGEQFCAGSLKNGKSVLQMGDSGGPLLYEEFNYPTYQVGIMSFGANLTKHSPNVIKPDIFQNVHLYLEWILDHIEP